MVRRVTRVRGSVGSRLWRGGNPGEQRLADGGQPAVARADSRGDQGFEADEAAGTGWSRCAGPRASGKAGDRWKRRPSSGGSRGEPGEGLASAVKPGGRGHEHRTSGTAAENHKGAERPRERTATRSEEQRSEGRTPRTVCGMEQGREARVCWQTAGRLREPESGTATGVDVPVVHGASPGDVVEGARNLAGAGPGV